MSRQRDKLHYDISKLMQSITALYGSSFDMAPGTSPDVAIDRHKMEITRLERIRHIHKSLNDLVTDAPLSTAERRAGNFGAEVSEANAASFLFAQIKKQTKEEVKAMRAAAEADVAKSMVAQAKDLDARIKATDPDLKPKPMVTNRKLSDEDVAKIFARRKRGGPGSGVETLAVEFNCSTQLIYAILKGKASAYSHLNAA